MQPDPISLSSPSGMQMLRESHLSADFFQLTRWFETQATRGHCGIATGVMILNALEIPKPLSVPHDPYRFFTQAGFFTKGVSGIKTEDDVMESGLGIDEFSAAMSTFPVRVTTAMGSEINESQFRELILGGLQKPGVFVVCNYSRSALNQEGGGHFSPLAAFHPGRDSVLILDVARYKCPSVWVTISQLHQAVAELIESIRRSRGLILIESPEAPVL